MNKVIKRAWLSALKSGYYTQGQGQLRRRKKGLRADFVNGRIVQTSMAAGHCCLGVLCEVMGVKYEPDGEVLPKMLALAVQISSKHQDALAKLNDMETPDGFQRVSDYIKAKL